MNLLHKTAIVTGSSMGIGKRIAEQLAQAGASVVINARNKERLERTRWELEAKGMRIAAFVGDVSDPAVCQGLAHFALDTFGSIDILVNNVGVGSRGHFENTNPEVFQYVLNSNILGVVYPTLSALPQLKLAKGSVIFISSWAGFHGMPNASAYCMSKRAISSLAESLRVETAQEDLHVGIVYVGITKNDPDKKVLYSDGHWGNLDSHNGLFVDAPEDTAKAVLDAIQNRRFETIVGMKGKAYYWIQKLAPWFVDFTFRHQMNVIESAQH
jgi:short-subunit dehydrogenase